MSLVYKNKICYFLFIFFINLTVNAQYSHSLQNYTLTEYNAGNQNWDITKAKNGKLYVANNEGLLEFDGINWNLWEMPNKTTIRSLLIDNDRIYVGSYEEFGYWTRDKKGVLNYNSLIKNNQEENKPKNDEEFWQILLINDTIIFRSFSNIYLYNQDRITSYSLPSTIMSCNVIDGKLYASTLNDGIFILHNDKFKLFINSTILQNTRIVSLNKISTNQFLITTAIKGCFLIKEGKITSWNTEINSSIKEHQLNRFNILDNGNMVFGTIKNGVYITDHFGEILFNINKEIGLINNTVLGQYISSDNELWLGLDNGISFIDLNTPNYFYIDILGKLGAVYDIIKFDNTIYLASNTGLYYLDEENNLQFIDGSQGQVWDLKEINGELFCGHNNGTYLIKNKNLKLLSNFTGGWVIKKVPEHKNSYVQGTYSGLVSFKKENDKWSVKHLGKTTIPIRYLVFEDKNTAWAAHANKGIFRVKFDPNYEKIRTFKDYSKKGLWSNFNVRIYKLKNTIAFHTIKGWQKYEELLDSIVPYDLLNDKIGNDSYIISEENMTPTASILENSISLFSEISTDKKLIISNKYYNERLVSGNENISKISDSTLALNLYNGYMIINAADFSKKEILNKPIFERISVNNRLIDINSYNIQLPYNNHNIVISISSPTSKNHSFEYNLINSKYNSKWSTLKKGKLELSNLPDGDYTISFRTINNNQNKSAISSLKFKVLPPFFKSKKAFFMYLLLLILISLIFYMLHRRKIKKEQKLVQLKYEEAQKKLLAERALENEKDIINLKNESLKNEVKLKSKQLANSAMSLVKKNEALLALKKEFILNKNIEVSI